MPGRSIPTFSFGGFLGAGKTTLINHLLRQVDGQRIVVFVNDFGALNIDYDLIETVEADRVALSNGCVCCTLNEDLVQSIAQFCKSAPPDMFMIEASGVANPRALDASLQALNHAGLTHTQKQIYLVDADQFGGLDYADTEELVDHAAASDLVVINKSDLVDKTRLLEIAELLERSAPGASLHQTSHGQLSLPVIAHSEGRGQRRSDSADSPPAKKKRYETFAFEGFPPLSQARFDDLVSALKAMCLRAKGVVVLADQHETALRIQHVGQRIDFQSLEPSADKSSKLVTIGWPERIDTAILNDILGSGPLD